MGKRSGVQRAIEQVREAKDEAGAKLKPAEYKEFLEGLAAEAAGWRMELEESEGE